MINKINKSNKDEYIKYLEDEFFNLRKICIEKELKYLTLFEKYSKISFEKSELRFK